MTVWRWTQRGVLPKPVVINGRNYWASEQLDAYDAARVAVGVRREAAA
jgi:hypothetical protein